MLYNFTTATDYVGLLQYVETGVHVPFAEISVIIVFFTSFFIFLRFGPVKSFAATSVISFLTALFLLALGIMPSFYVTALAIAVALSIILLYFSEG